MPVSNLNNDHFTQAEMDAMNKLWNDLMSFLITKSRNLSPDERQKFGSISEENKLVVQKTLDYHANQPHLDCPDVDYAETILDWTDRSFSAAFMAKFAEARNIFNNIRITHDYDAYRAAQMDYNFAKYKMGTDPGAGWESKYEDLLLFFKTNNSGGGSNDDAPQEPPITP